MRVERKRILNRKIFALIIIVGLAFSIFSAVKNFNSYNVYDSSGKVVISAKENLAESKKVEHNVLLDYELLTDIVNEVDKSNYLYNINTIRLLLATYQDKNISELTQHDIEHFYEQRIHSIEFAALRPLDIFTEEQIEHLKMKTSKIETPLPIGYSEGWKNLNNDMSNLLFIVLLILSVLLLQVFGGSEKTNMNELCNSTRHGKTMLIKAKMIAGLEIASIVYFSLVIMLTIIQLLVFGANGYNLAIQSDPFYFVSSWNLTFLEQYLLNIFIGYVAIIFMTVTIFFFTVITEKIMAGGVLTTFFWIFMLTLPSNLFTSFGITHNLSNFFPYNMTNFNRLSRNNEIYEVFGQMIPSYLWIVMVVLSVTIGIVLSTYMIATFKLSKKHLMKN